MTTRDASKLAYTKFRTRKFRSILVVVGSACITALVLFFSIASSGIRHSISGNATPYESMNLLLVRKYNIGPDPDPAVVKTNESVWEGVQKEKNIDPSHVKNVYYASHPNQMKPASLSELQKTTATDVNMNYFYGSQFEVRSTELLSPYVVSGQSLQIGTDGVLPIIVSGDVIHDKHGAEIDAIKDVQARVKKITELEQQYIGKIQTLTIQYMPISKQAPTTEESDLKPVTVPARIVGFSPTTSGFISSLVGGTSGDMASIVTTYEAASKVAEVQKTIPTTDTMYVSFDNKDNRTAAVEKFKNDYTYQAEVFGDISNSIKGITDSAKKILKWVAIMMLVFVTVPMMSTMGKILADSQRETGVFRAIGARNRDIAKIYLVYSVILSSLAFGVAVVISSTIALVLTAKYGGVLSAQLTEITGSAKVLHVTMYGVSLAHWIILYGLLIASAVLGATIPVLRTLRKDPILAMRDE